ncbi:MAG: hypothetical protein K0Q52_135 [Microbacterium sp.]|jgi:hypothetical protein|nr:hypothetical protein [Microbacterium sp.]
MRARHARQIRRGIVTAREVMARKRMRPNLTPFGFAGAPQMPLWEIAYHREFSCAVRDGRIRPPRGPSGASRP